MAEEGDFTMYVPLLPGRISEWDIFEEAVKNIVETAIPAFLYI